MTIAVRIKQLLDAHRVPYRVLAHTKVNSLTQAAELLNLDPSNVLTAQVLADKLGPVIVAYPLSAKIDLIKINQRLKRNLNQLDAIQVNRLFNDCDSGCWPPIGQPYKIDVIIDQSIQTKNIIYFSAGSYTSLLEISVSNFMFLNPRAKLIDCVMNMSQDEKLALGKTHKQKVFADTKSLLESLDFPELSSVALKILGLLSAGTHSAQELVDIVSQDQDIHQQILLYAQLPKVQGAASVKTNKDVQEIVDHVLGFEMVSHIALGVAAGRAFNPGKSDPDTAGFWRHAIYAAAYAEQLSHLVAEQYKIDPAISYLAGLFHNFGLLLVSQMFAPEYRLLKKWMLLNPLTPIPVLEQRLLGMGRALDVLRGGHAQLGASLLRHWGIPEAICVITQEHHSNSYNGEYQAYVKIIQITNQLLREIGIGDGTIDGLAPESLAALGLNEVVVRETIKNLPIGISNLEQMAQSLTNK